MDHVSGIPLPVREAIEKLNRAISEDVSLKSKIVNTLERYLSDNLWPSNFRELEKALDKLVNGLLQVLRTSFILYPDSLDSLREHLPDELAAFLEDLQKLYAYKYRVAAFRTILSSDGYGWYTVHVQKFSKNNQQCYGISIVRNDGEQIYFEGVEESINQMIGIIQGAMKRGKEVETEEV